MRRLALCSLTVVALAACGSSAARPTSRATPAASQPSSPRFVKPPLVLLDRDGGDWLRVWVRLDRELKYNVGTPGEYRREEASLEVAGGEHDIPGLGRDPVRPTCYGEDLFLSEETKLVDGQPVEVTLRLDDAHQLKATVPVQVRDVENPTKELGCPSQTPGEPRMHRCRGSVYGEGGSYEVGLASARGTSCRTTRKVMRSVSAITTSRCYRDLCVRKHRRHLGFRCDAALMGEATWDIVCRRGHVEVRGNAAD